MKKVICVMLSILLLLNGMGNMETYAKEEAIHVLIVGNSFSRYRSDGVTYSVKQPLEELAAGEGHDLKVTTLAHSSARLCYYAGMNEAYLSYHNELLALLKDEKWDYIIFQEQSTSPIESFDTSTYPAVEALLCLVKNFQPQATPLLYMTQGYSNGASIKVNGVPRVLLTEDMQLYLAAAYKTLEHKLGVEAVPAGMHAVRANKLYPQIQLTGPDDKHPTYAGYYLAACSFYQRIYGNVPDPRKAVLKNCNITEQELVSLASLTADSMTMNKKNITLSANKTAKLTATPSNHVSEESKVTYTSLDTSVAAVNAATGAVKAKGGGSTSIVAETSDGLQAFCDVTVRCAAPKGVKAASSGRTAEAADFGKIKISWNAVTGAASYDIYRAASKKGTYKRIGTSKTTSYTDKNAAVDKCYYYKVKARNKYDACTSPWSRSTRGIILKAPTLKGERTASKYVKLTWKKNKKATGYVIYRSAKKNSGYEKAAVISSKSTTGYIDKTVNKKKSYYYRIKAYKKLDGKVFYGVKSLKVQI